MSPSGQRDAVCGWRECGVDVPEVAVGQSYVEAEIVVVGVRGVAGFGDGYYPRLPQDPCQRDACRRGIVPCGYSLQGGVCEQAAFGYGRIGHDGHSPVVAPAEQVVFHTAFAHVVQHLVSGATVPSGHRRYQLHVRQVYVAHSPPCDFAFALQFLQCLDCL